MNRDDIIRIAREAEVWPLIDHDGIAALERFAELLSTQRRPLNTETIFNEAERILTRIQVDDWVAANIDVLDFARAIERAHGIGGGDEPR